MCVYVYIYIYICDPTMKLCHKTITTNQSITKPRGLPRDLQGLDRPADLGPSDW